MVYKSTMTELFVYLNGFNFSTSQLIVICSLEKCGIIWFQCWRYLFDFYPSKQVKVQDKLFQPTKNDCHNIPLSDLHIYKSFIITLPFHNSIFYSFSSITLNHPGHIKPEKAFFPVKSLSRAYKSTSNLRFNSSI